jgi:hypothetical protein
VNPFRATPEQNEAASNQSKFYAEIWENDRQHLYQEYLKELNCTSFDCRKQALDKSISNASGSHRTYPPIGSDTLLFFFKPFTRSPFYSHAIRCNIRPSILARIECGINRGAAAWFWFIVMTTVGYGDQSPSTKQGRAMVACLGWISIVVWAMILYVAGSVVGIIVDDFFRKFHLKFMTGDIAGVIFWGLMGTLWILLMSIFTLYWWNDRIRSFDGTLQDSLWFCYISLLTVGEHPCPTVFFL